VKRVAIAICLSAAAPAAAQVAPAPAAPFCDALLGAVDAARAGSMAHLAPRGAFAAQAFSADALPIAACATPVAGFETCSVVVAPAYESWSVQTGLPVQGAQGRLDEVMNDVAACLEADGEWTPSEALSPPNVQVEANVIDASGRAHVAVRAAQISADEVLIAVLASPTDKLLREFGGGPATAEDAAKADAGAP
jgi:hypothetical protein